MTKFLIAAVLAVSFIAPAMAETPVAAYAFTCKHCR